MRSRTSRGVPEWSGGEDLYVGSCHTVTGKVRGHIGIVPGPPEGFWGPPGGATSPGGPHGLWREGNQPLEGWAHPPLGPMRLGLGGNPKGAPPCLGGKPPSPWPPPPSRSHLEGAGPLPPSPINRGVRGGLHTQAKAQPLPSPTPLLLRTCLAKPCRSTAASPPPRRRAAVGALFLNLSLLLAGSRRGRRPCSVRVLNAEVPSVRR